MLRKQREREARLATVMLTVVTGGEVTAFCVAQRVCAMHNSWVGTGLART